MSLLSRLGLLSFFLALIPTLYPPSDGFGQEETRTGLVTAEGVNLRSGPGLNYEALIQLPKGARLQVFLKQGDWYGVAFPREVPVFVSREHLQWDGGTQAEVKAKRLHVRVGAGGAFTSLGTLTQGESVRAAKAWGDWLEIEPPDFCRGWLHQSFINVLDPEEEVLYGDDRTVRSN